MEPVERPPLTHWLFESQVENTPTHPAVASKQTCLSYMELNQRANHLARYLRSLNIPEELPVGICLTRSIDLVITVLGVWKAGASYVPLDPAHPPDRLNFILADSQVPFLLTHRALLPKLPSTGAQVICLEDIPLTLDSSPVGGAAGVDPLAYIMYTSGSTGKPKGVQVTHQPVVNFLKAMQSSPGIAPNDVLLSVSPLSFDISILELFLPLTVGAKVVVAPHEVVNDGKRLAQLLDECGATVMQGTPATWRLLLEAGWSGSKKLKILCGGEAWPASLAEQLLPKCSSLWNMYGPTETTVWCSVQQIEPGQPVLLGKPILNSRFHVLNGSMQPMPIGEAGELYVGGACVASGYLNRPELTAQKFLPDPFTNQPGARLYKTGDLVRCRSDGNFEYVGRLDHQIKIRGFRIEPGEIEAVCQQHPEVKQAIVTVQEIGPEEKRLVAHIIRSAPASLGQGELREFLRSKLPDYMVPAVIVFHATFPLNANGKVDRRALDISGQALSQAGSDSAPPRTKLEKTLAEVWCSVLKLRAVGIHDDFFAIGGYSLLAVRLSTELEKILGRPFPLEILAAAPTISKMAAVLSRDEPQRESGCLVRMRPSGSRPPLFLIHAVGGNVLNYGPLVSRLGQDQPVYGLQARGLDGKRPPASSLEEMAGLYIQEILQVSSDGPFHLVGLCFGGAVAFEMAQQLRRDGKEVALLGLLNPSFSHVPAEFVCDYPTSGVRFRTELWYAVQQLHWHRLPAPLRRIKTVNARALGNYVPAPYDGRIVLFRTTELGRAEWRESEYLVRVLAQGEIEVCDLPGNRISTLNEPNVCFLAHQLRARLRKTDVRVKMSEVFS